MMLFIHMDSTQMISLYVYGGTSIWSYLYLINSPVPLFLIISGYGFYFVAQKERDNNYWLRVVKLFIHFWTILLIFIPFMHHDSFEVLTVLSNFSAWYVSWNGTCWFVFPYAVFALTYRQIYNLGNKIGFLKLLGISLTVYLFAGFCISRYSVNYQTSLPLAYNSLYLLFSQFSFILGMSLNKYALLRTTKSEKLAIWGG